MLFTLDVYTRHDEIPSALTFQFSLNPTLLADQQLNNIYPNNLLTVKQI